MEIAEIEKLMQLSIDAVFVQRYRDVDALLREKCVESIHAWITTYPEVFLDNAYLRYIGWSLSDKSIPCTFIIPGSLEIYL